jgi:hypothetical protein
METASQIHASAALFLCTKPANVIEYEKERAPELTVTLWGTQNYCRTGNKTTILRSSSL